MPSLTLIVAATLANGIGQGGQLPWRLSRDMAYFARVTTHAPEGGINAVIMGRNTWESIPLRNRPLKQRRNVIITSDSNYLKEQTDSQVNAGQPTVGVSVQTSFQDAIASVANPADNLHRAFIIGGASIYKTALELSALSGQEKQVTIADRILMTRILSPEFEDCDVFFPEFRNAKAQDGTPLWTQATHDELEAWIGGEVPQGTQREKGIEYEFQMWTRK